MDNHHLECDEALRLLKAEVDRLCTQVNMLVKTIDEHQQDGAERPKSPHLRVTLNGMRPEQIED